MLTATLALINLHLPSRKRCEHLLQGLGGMYIDRMPLPIERVLAINGFDDALCALPAVKGHDGAIRLFACYCARYCLETIEREYPCEKRPRQAVETAERHARGQATDAELDAARDSVCDACNTNSPSILP